LRGGFAGKDFLILPPYMLLIASLGLLGFLCAAIWLVIGSDSA
jgi:hypothetical protein